MKCQNPPVFRYTWPGRDEKYICLEHCEQMQNVARAMGLYLQMIQLTNDDQMKIALSGDGCSQEVKEKA